MTRGVEDQKILVCPALLLCCGVFTFAQSTGTIRGTVSDPSGAVIAGATVEIQNPVSHYTQQTKTDDQGNFQFANVPYNNYHVTVSAPGFSSSAQDTEVRTSVPVQMMKFSLQLGAAESSVTVEAAPDLIETGTTTHTDIDRGLFDKLPNESASSSLSSLVTLSAPGVSADSNGLNYYPSDNPYDDFSPDFQSESVSQSRRLLNAGVRSDVSYIQGAHNLKVGAEYEHTFLTEGDSFGIVDPELLAGLDCLSANGKPMPGTPCAILAPYDLGTGGAPFLFHGHADVNRHWTRQYFSWRPV